MFRNFNFKNPQVFPNPSYQSNYVEFGQLTLMNLKQSAPHYQYL